MKDDTLILLGLGAAAIFWISSQDVRTGLGDTVAGAGAAVSGLGSGIGSIGRATGDIAGDVSGFTDDFFGLGEDIFESARSGLNKFVNRKNDSDSAQNQQMRGGTKYSKANPFRPAKDLVTQSDYLTSALKDQGYSGPALRQTTEAALTTQQIFGGSVLLATKDVSSGSYKNVKIIKKNNDITKKAARSASYSVSTVGGGTIPTKKKIANRKPLTAEQQATARKFGLI